MKKSYLSPFPLLNFIARECQHLSDRERFVAIAIALHRQATTALCSVSIREICKETGHGSHVVVSTVRNLFSKGILEVQKGAGTTSHSYVFLYDRERADEVRKHNDNGTKSLPY